MSKIIITKFDLQFSIPRTIPFPSPSPRSTNSINYLFTSSFQATAKS